MRLMALGFGLLRLSPKDFWTMTLPEFQAAISLYVPTQAAALPRGRMDALMRAFPDLSI